MSQDDALSALAEGLLIPTNPTVDLSASPIGDFEYANPVTLNNQLLLYGNAVIQATDRIAACHKQIEAAKLAKRKAERQLEDFEQAILRKYPLPKGTGTLKVIDAYIARMAVEEKLHEQYADLKDEVRKQDDERAKWEAREKTTRMWLDAIDRASQNITTHLSFVKYESGPGRR